MSKSISVTVSLSVAEERDHKLSESLLDQYTEVLANRDANLKVSLGRRASQSVG